MNEWRGAQFLVSAAQISQLPAPDRPEVAFAGRSNSGKSSALNALCGQTQLARVSRTPGRTQLLNFFDIPGGRLVDLPGYGYADVAREQQRDWSQVLAPYIERRECLAGIVLTADIRHALTDFDRQMLAWSFRCNRHCHLLLTKSDKLGSGAAKAALTKVKQEMPKFHPAATTQLFSSTKRTGVDEAIKVVEDWMLAPSN